MRVKNTLLDLTRAVTSLMVGGEAGVMGRNCDLNNNVWYMVFGLIFLVDISAYAAELPIKINGFASAGLVAGDLDAEFISGTDVIGESATFGGDNTIGIQISADMNKTVNFTGQFLAKGVIDGYNLDAHWAFIDYHPHHNFSIRAGRLVLPIVMGSEYVDVGYAYPWVRPPMEVYSGVPMTSYSGIDVLYTVEMGDNILTLQPYIGSVPPSSSIGFDLDVESGFGLNTAFQFEYGSIRAHALSVNDAAGSDASGVFDFGMDVQLFVVGADLEIGNVVLISEYMKKKFEFTGLEPYSTVDGEAWFVTLGYRVGEFLPHITFASADSDVRQAPALEVVFSQMLASDPALATLFSDMSLADQQAFRTAFTSDPIAFLSDPTVQALLSASEVSMDPSQLQALPALAEMQLPPAPLAYKQQSITLGLRYEILPRTALKLEYQEIRPQEESWGLFRQDPGDKVSLVSFAIDVTF